MIFIPFVYIFSFFLGSVVVQQEVVMDTNIYTFLITDTCLFLLTFIYISLFISQSY